MLSTKMRTWRLAEAIIHPDTLSSMDNLALVFDGQGKYEAAEEMHRRTLELREKVLGPEHPDMPERSRIKEE